MTIAKELSNIKTSARWGANGGLPAGDREVALESVTDNGHGADGEVHIHVQDCWPSNDGIDGYVFAKAKRDGDRLVVKVKVWGEITDDASELAVCINVVVIRVGDSSR